jgi:hypothetical protein
VTPGPRSSAALPHYTLTTNRFDNFCLTGGWGIRVAYASACTLATTPRRHRAGLAGRIVLALTANPYYSLHGVRPGMTLAAAAHRVSVGRGLRIGVNEWNLGPADEQALTVSGGLR